MFGSLGVHVLKNPSGSYSFVGTLPAALGELRPMTRADALAGRGLKTATGEYVALHFPSFTSRAEALTYAAERGVSVKAE